MTSLDIPQFVDEFLYRARIEEAWFLRENPRPFTTAKSLMEEEFQASTLGVIGLHLNGKKFADVV